MNQSMLARVRRRQHAVNSNARLRQQRENYLAMVKENRKKEETRDDRFKKLIL
jgi:hypothetical protein